MLIKIAAAIENYRTLKNSGYTGDMLPSIQFELLGPHFTSLLRFEVGRTQCKKSDVTYMHGPIKIQITTATQVRCKFLCVSV